MPKILIADDDPNILKLSSIVFRDIDYTVIEAVDGADAINKAKKERPDIILTDLLMPEKSGHDLCRFVRQMPEISHIPIIIISAMDDEYYKLTGFEEGADDYITKPFNIDELKARVKGLIMRSRFKGDQKSPLSLPDTAKETLKNTFHSCSTGIKALDERLFGGLPQGSNILVLGSTGSGKSSLSRTFLQKGWENSEPGLMVVLDDDPQKVRLELSKKLGKQLEGYEADQLLRLVDAYSWCTPNGLSNERFSVSGALDLTGLSHVISDAGYELGQTVQAKKGGRRIVDSISSLFIHFPINEVHYFLSQISRTALAFGGVTTLFILEKDAVPVDMINQIKFTMDGVIELEKRDAKNYCRVESMKWADYTPNWFELDA